MKHPLPVIPVALVALLALGTADASAQSSANVPTWTDDVGPLMAESCMNCHRPSQVAPMSLMTYEETTPWARSIALMVRNRIMPPWHADPEYGHFGNNRRLTDDEIGTILSWIEGGMPRGEEDFQPPEFAEGWLYAAEAGRPPDYVFEFEQPFQIPATGPDVYADVVVPTTHTEDIWVQAVEVRGNSRVVHHSGVRVIRPDGSSDPTGRLAAYTPGKQYDRFPEGSGKMIPVGSELVFGMHYNTTGQPEEDIHRVGVWLAEGPIEYQIYSTVAADGALQIPPYEANYQSTADFEFERDSEITLMKPHMHWRGKDMLFRVRHANGAVDTLLSVPRYDMNWQISYELADPLPVEAGSRLEVISHFDNSEDNPWNPDPSLQVIWGQESRDEMMEGWFDYRVKMDEPVIPSAVPARTAGVLGVERTADTPVAVSSAPRTAGAVAVDVGAPPEDPSGIWNIETSLLADRPTKGVRNSLLRIRWTGLEWAAEMTTIRNTFVEVDNFWYENGRARFTFGAFDYDLRLGESQVIGSVYSPAGTQGVQGARQANLTLAGNDVPEFTSTREGTIGHRTSFAPPADVADPAEWVISRIQSPQDWAIVTRSAVAVEFTNAADFQARLRELAGQRVNLTATWRGEKLEIVDIAPIRAAGN